MMEFDRPMTLFIGVKLDTFPTQNMVSSFYILSWTYDNSVMSN